MKPLLATLLSLIMIMTTANAQKITGSFAPLRNESRVQMTVDFSKASIMGMSEEFFSDYEPDWHKDKNEILFLFNSYVNEALHGHPIIGNYSTGTDYIIQIIVQAVDFNGNYDYDILLFSNFDNTPSLIAQAEGFYSRGGKFGTKLNLMKDGAKHSGTTIGLFLQKELFKRY